VRDFVSLQGGPDPSRRSGGFSAVDDKRVAFDGDFASNLSVDRVILEAFRRVVVVEEVVDSEIFDILAEVMTQRGRPSG
jgi:hypothetical protein